MIIKITGCILIISSGLFAGMYTAKNISQKTEFISQYIVFLTQAKAMIEFSGAGIREILMNVHSVPLLDNITGETLGRMDTGEDFTIAWTKSVKSSLERKEFESEDFPLLVSFGEGFGEMGIEEEVSKIKLHLSTASSRLENLKKDTMIRQRLYRTVGTFCGVLAAVIMI